jgi:hypothetical protein
VLSIDLHRLKKGGPGAVKLHKHLVGHFGGKGFVRLRLFEQMKDVCVIQIGVLENERLPNMLIGQVPEVF